MGDQFNSIIDPSSSFDHGLLYLFFGFQIIPNLARDFAVLGKYLSLTLFASRIIKIDRSVVKMNWQDKSTSNLETLIKDQ